MEGFQPSQLSKSWTFFVGHPEETQVDAALALTSNRVEISFERRNPSADVVSGFVILGVFIGVLYWFAKNLVCDAYFEIL
ncbi:MAG: hypothetical protein EXS36_04460 [Pedosphaera sp.]|nr:hypothetical protein [Pedosphaera sp.]